MLVVRRVPSRSVGALDKSRRQVGTTEKGSYKYEPIVIHPFSKFRATDTTSTSRRLLETTKIKQTLAQVKMPISRCLHKFLTWPTSDVRAYPSLKDVVI